MDAVLAALSGQAAAGQQKGILDGSNTRKPCTGYASGRCDGSAGYGKSKSTIRWLLVKFSDTILAAADRKAAAAGDGHIGFFCIDAVDITALQNIVPNQVDGKVCCVRSIDK